jgi:ABC-2 type transport system ATP-binding protein
VNSGVGSTEPPRSGGAGSAGAGAGISTAVAVTDLRKSYGAHEAVRGVGFEIAVGEVFGLLGPNGAGKTTIVEILEGYRKRDGGSVAVLGSDPERAGREWRERVGVVLQSSSLYPNLTVRESLDLFAGYYERPRDVVEVLSLVGLVEKADSRVRLLSGGQKRRLDLGLALVGDPELLFLDEPTTGFDPAARRTAWETVRSLRSLGKTILLTTHYLDEAEQLADRVAVLVQGKIVTLGSPAELRGGSAETEIRYRRNGQEVVLRTGEPTRVLHELTSAAVAAGHELEALEVRRPSLEEIYLDLTAENGG